MSVRLSVYCDKDGNHTIRSAITENPMLHSNLSALYVTEAELLPTEVVRWGNRDFQHIWLLWPWPWPNDLHMTFPHCTSSFSEWLNVREHRILTRIIIYELDLYPLEIYWMRENEIPCEGFRKLSSDRQTGPKLCTTPLLGWSIIMMMMTPCYNKCLTVPVCAVLLSSVSPPQQELDELAPPRSCLPD